MTSIHSSLAKLRRRETMLRLLGMKLLSRLLLLVCSLSAVSVFLLTRCGLNFEDSNTVTSTGIPVSRYNVPKIELDTQPEPLETISSNDKIETKSQKEDIDSYVQLLQQREEENRIEVERLTAEIRSLKLQLLQYTNAQINATQYDSSDCTRQIRRQIMSSELLQGVSLNNEYEVVPYTHFTLNRIYPVDLSLGKRVVEKPIGYKRKDLLEVLLKTLEILNSNEVKNIDLKIPKSDNKKKKHIPKNLNNTKLEIDKIKNKIVKNKLSDKSKYSLEDFIEGLYRTEPTTGTQYDLYFRTKTSDVPSYTKVTVMRPFAPLVNINKEIVPNFKKKEKELIHIILPLSGRTKTFQGFMDKFVKIALKHDGRVHLTVVYFGEDGLSEARLIMSKVVQAKGASLRLLALNETFSRGKGLRVGAERTWDNEPIHSNPDDVLLFMCDVDVVFSARFLDRCRWNTQPGRKVYYPIVFSLYNPHVVYTLQGKEVPPEPDQLVVSRDTGFWRDFGYGMTCQYRSDFLKVRGFDEDIVGWGGEDVVLYRKYVKSKVKVIRATDPGIFHIWHTKVCSRSPEGQKLSTDQYRACIRSRALNEASHAQLGFLAFKDDVQNTFQNKTKNA